MESVNAIGSEPMSVIPLTKKEIERWQLDRFIEAFPGFPDGSIEASEEPDFLIRHPQRSIGIELTDLYWKSPTNGIPQQAQESLRNRIVKEAQRLYTQRGLPNLHVSVHFNPSYTPTKKNVLRLAIAIDELVAKNVPPLGEPYSEDYDWENRSYFPEEVIHIGAWNLPNAKTPFFTSPSASFVPTLEADDVVRALALKESKLPSYRQSCDEAWLLVNFDVGQLSTFFEHDDEVFHRAYSSGFDRVFLFRQVRSEIHELKLVVPSR